MVDYYFSPFQYELREGFVGDEGSPGLLFKAASLAGRAGVPAPVTATAFGDCIPRIYATSTTRTTCKTPK